MNGLTYCNRGAAFIDANKFEKGAAVCRNCTTYPTGVMSRCDQAYKESNQ